MIHSNLLECKDKGEILALDTESWSRAFDAFGRIVNPEEIKERIREGVCLNQKLPITRIGYSTRTTRRSVEVSPRLLSMGFFYSRKGGYPSQKEVWMLRRILANCLFRQYYCKLKKHWQFLYDANLDHLNSFEEFKEHVSQVNLLFKIPYSSFLFTYVSNTRLRRMWSEQTEMRNIIKMTIAHI